MNGLVVIQPGLFTTVQDLGRPGHRAFGVPAGGAFDAGSAARWRTPCSETRPNAALLEITLTGGTYEAAGSLALALAGALAATLRHASGQAVPLRTPTSFTLRAGERLSVGSTLRGARAYLAVDGGWLTPVVLGSRSSESPLQAGDVLPSNATGVTPVRHLDPEDDPFATPAEPLRVVDGPDAGRVAAGLFDTDASYRVSPRSDRMGLRLDGPPWEVTEEPERLSTPVAPGAVQAAGGRPVILGVACGTMGGLPPRRARDRGRPAATRTGQAGRLPAVRAGDVGRGPETRPGESS